MKPILFTGLRPTGDLHLGHYVSLIQPLMKYKGQYQIFIMIADLHAQTELRKDKVNYQCFSDDLNSNTMFALQIITDFLSPDEFVVFRQSDLKEYHLDLFYKLLMISRHNQVFGNPIFIDAMKTELFKIIDLLKLHPKVREALKIFINDTPESLYGHISEPMTNKLVRYLSALLDWGEVKLTTPLIEKIVKQLNTRIGVMGFATYPILMAADILLYQPEYTLVGKDQNPHIQITNDLAKNINNTFGFSIKGTTAMIDYAQTLKGIDGSKMSKTLGNYIPLKSLLSDSKSGVDLFLKMKSHPHRLNEPGNAAECLVGEYWNAFDSYLNHPINIGEICSTGRLGCERCKFELFDHLRIIIQRDLRCKRIFEDTDKMFREGAEVARQRIMEGELIKKHFIG